MRDAAVPRARPGGVDAGHAGHRRHRRRAGASSTRCRSGASRAITARPGIRRCRRSTSCCSRASKPARPQPAGAEKLRFIRSCSASLPPQVMHDLEAAFGAPVLEAYGMTEAAHQMASNPLPPGDAQARIGRAGHRRPASASWTTRAGTCAPGERGEVVHPGPERDHAATRTIPRPTPRRSSTAGSAPATRASSTSDGYLTLIGRLKELINRGGEKISPREIDEVLLDAPGGRRGGVLRRAAPRPGAKKSRRPSSLQRARSTEADLLALLQGAAGRLQAAEADSHHRDDSAHRHRQDPAPRRRAGVRAEAARENRHRRRRRDRRLHRRAARAGRRRRRAVRARPAPAGDAGARAARRSAPDGDFEVQPAGDRRPRDDRPGRRRVPRRQGAQPDRAGADAARRCSAPTRSSSARRTASRGGTSRATAASSTGCASSASIPAA